MAVLNLKYLVYENRPRYDSSLKWLVSAILGLTFIPAIILLNIDIIGPWALLAGTALDALLLYIIIPRKYQVFSDRVKIVLGGPFSIDLRFSTIEEVCAVTDTKTFVYWGVRMATSSKGIIEIVRQSGIDVVISPRDSDTFLGQIREAMDTHRTD